MSSARHPQPLPHPHTRPAPTRRGLLRGGMALGVAAAAGLTAAAPALAASTGPAAADDYPGAEWVPANSANFTVANRPRTYPVDFVVIHVTQELYRDALAIFQDPARAVSIHYLVRSADGHIAQTVHEKDVAWHAGNWDYNTRSIGIEHEGFVDDPSWFTDAMYDASAALTARVCSTYGIPVDRQHIIGHQEVPGATHTDPGPEWDWARYIDLVKAH